MAEERRRDATNVVVRDKAGRVLLFRRDNKPNIPYPDFYDALGGVVEDGETAQEGAIREALEEGGVVLDPAKLRLSVVYRWPNQTEWNFAYMEPIEVDTEAWTPTEGQGIEWHTPEEIADFDGFGARIMPRTRQGILHVLFGTAE